MLPNKKIIAFDLDGTLAPSKSVISEHMAILLKKLIEKKIVVVISGGKFEQFMTQFFSSFNHYENMLAFIDNLVLLPTSGTQRYSFNKIKKEWELVDKEPLGDEVKVKIKKLLQDIIDSGSYDIPANPFGDIVEDRDTQITFSGRGQQAPIEEKRAWDPDKKKRQKIKEAIEGKMPEVSMYVNAYSSIDILPKGFNKAIGLSHFLDKVGLSKSDVLFVGDGLFPGGNDYSIYTAHFDTFAVKGPDDTERLLEGWLAT
ncbi:MAG: HAD-IIB family hydrolase [Patescibacteria group bacterium]